MKHFTLTGLLVLHRGKTTMNHIVCLLLVLAGTVFAGEVPYGHRDFYPSAQRPIGYNADGSNCFPGATPVTEWWDGTVTTVTLENPKTPGKKVALPGFADDKSRNVAWKVRLPGASDAQPAVIGDRLVTVCHPDHVVCLDAQTGRILWQHRVGPLLCDDLPEETAARLQERFDLELLQLFFAPRVISRYFPRIEADPAAAAALQERMQRMTARIDELEKAGFGRAALVKQQVPLSYPWLAPGYLPSAVCTPISDGQKVWVTFAQGQTACFDLNGKRLWATRVKVKQKESFPTSYYANPLLCGRTLIVTPLSGNTIYAYDADTGKLRWSTAVSSKATGNMVNDRFLSPCLMTLSLPDGRPLQVILTNTEDIMRVSDGKIIGRFPQPTGKEPPKRNHWSDGGGLNRIAHGNQVLLSCQGHASSVGSAISIFTLKAESEETITFSAHYLQNASGKVIFDQFVPSSFNKLAGYVNVAMLPEGILLAPITPIGDAKGKYDKRSLHAWDLRSGRYLSSLYEPPAGRSHSLAQGEDYGAAFTVLGRRLYHPVLRHTDSDHPGGSGTGRFRPDQLTAAAFAIVDLTDPARPTPVASTNLIGTTEYPSDVYWDTWLADPKLPKAYGCGKMFYGGFGLRTSGPVACGNRFWVQSSVHMYCIGDPAVKYDWNPASRPEAVTRSLQP